MFRSTLLVAAAALSSVASAQLLSNGLNYSTSGALEIATSQIEPALLSTWCNAQTNNCPKICGGRSSENTCDSSTLNYTCTCFDNSTPNISDYTETVPFYVCQQWITNCVDNHPNDLTGLAGCRSVTCGSQNASAATTSTAASEPTSSTASSNSETTGTTSATASGASATPSEGAAIAMHVAQNYGSGILFSGLIALFGLAL